MLARIHRWASSESSVLARLRNRLRGLRWVAHRQQYAALPWRDGPSGLEILLITSRETRRWVIPKGWPMITFAPADAAAQEAYEEAGVRGDIAAEPVGAFRYRKRLKSGDTQLCRVDVYPLAVATEAKTWPEKRQRTRRWVPASDAARMVDEPGLRQIIEDFAAAAPDAA